MTPIISSVPAGGARLADVMSSAVRALCGEPNAADLGEVDTAVVVLVDGLGEQARTEFSGHARTLRSGDRRGPITASFPSTTAAGLTALCTGLDAGEHGFVGYRTYDSSRDRVVNMLSGWDDQMVPERWQPHPTLFERAQGRGIDAVVLGRRRYATSGLTRAILRSARYVAAETITDRFRAAAQLASAPGRKLVYLYVSELDEIAHSRGYRSDAWVEALEAVDAALRELTVSLSPRCGVVVTADHGIVDVPSEGHVVFGEVSELMAGVAHVSGEPRCLQLIVEGRDPAAARQLAAAWEQHEADRATVLTQPEAIEQGLLGSAVTDVSRQRLGDVIVAATAPVAYYAEGTDSARTMVGQHGSVTDAERLVPLTAFGAF